MFKIVLAPLHNFIEYNSTWISYIAERSPRDTYFLTFPHIAFCNLLPDSFYARDWLRDGICISISSKKQPSHKHCWAIPNPIHV
jgi:hypothetical protein